MYSNRSWNTETREKEREKKRRRREFLHSYHSPCTMCVYFFLHLQCTHIVCCVYNIAYSICSQVMTCHIPLKFQFVNKLFSFFSFVVLHHLFFLPFFAFSPSCFYSDIVICSLCSPKVVLFKVCNTAQFELGICLRERERE